MSDDDVVFFGDMLLRVREVDPNADADALHRYAREIADAQAVLQMLELHATTAPLPAMFSPDWVSEPSQ